jgi:small conductance mechanosensitive channel
VASKNNGSPPLCRMGKPCLHEPDSTDPSARTHRLFSNERFALDTLHTIWAFLATQGVDFGIKVIGAIAAWIIGRWLISLAAKFMERIFERAGRIDVTVAKYLATIVSGFLTLVLILALLGIFGIQTTSFVALLAGLGLAIGTAWGGLLAHFAAGVFLQVLRPFRVGDFVTAGTITGTVREIGLFFTKIVTPDNVETIVGNNVIFSGTIQNFSTLPFRRVECTAKIANGVDPRDAIERLRPVIAAIPNVETSRDPHLHAGRPAARGAAVHPYRPLLAGLVRYESHDRGRLHRRALSGSANADLVWDGPDKQRRGAQNDRDRAQRSGRHRRPDRRAGTGRREQLVIRSRQTRLTARGVRRRACFACVVRAQPQL